MSPNFGPHLEIVPNFCAGWLCVLNFYLQLSTTVCLVLLILIDQALYQSFYMLHESGHTGM